MEAINQRSASLLRESPLSPRDADQVINDLYYTNVEETKRLLDLLNRKRACEKINRCQGHFYTPLEKAASLGQLEKVKLLIKKGGAQDQPIASNLSSPRWSSLAAAALSSREDVVIYLLAKGAKADRLLFQGGEEVSLVFWLVTRYCASSDEWFLSKQEMLDTKQRQCRCLELILRSIEDLAAFQRQLFFRNESLLREALLSGRRDLVEILWKFGFDWADLGKEEDREDFVLHSMYKEHWDIVEWFIEKFSFNIKVKKQNGATLLHIAKADRKEPAVQYLLSLGVDPHALTNKGENYEAYAKRKLSKKAIITLARYLEGYEGSGVFDSLKECCAFIENEDINVPIGEEEQTLLHLAAQWPEIFDIYELLIPWLLIKGADKSVKNIYQLTPFDLATIKIRRLLKEKEFSREEIILLYKRAAILLEEALQ